MSSQALADPLVEETVSDFCPFEPLENVYEGKDEGRCWERILYAFGEVLGIPKTIIRSEFRAFMKETHKKEFPRLRCSTMRAIIEGRIPGIPKPVDPILPAWRNRLRKVLFLCDLLDTMVALHMEERLKKMTPKVQRELELVQNTMGTTHLPGLLESLFEIEKKTPMKKNGKKKTK